MSDGGAQSQPVRPTRDCLERDLKVGIPPLSVPLHEIDHAVVASAQQVPARVAAHSAERIRDLTDRVWLKDRAGQWRSAVVKLTKADFHILVGSWWIGAAGLRRADRDEPYAQWMKAARTDGNGSQVCTDRWLPAEWDAKRLQAEHAVAESRELREIVPRVIAMSLRSGKPISIESHRIKVSLLVRGGQGHRDRLSEVYLSVAAQGVPDNDFRNRLAIIKDSVPGIAMDDWLAEPAPISGLRPAYGQVVWSTLLSTEVQCLLLDQYPDDLDLD